MRLVVGAATDVGRVREANEDSFLLVEPVFAVADGMGGHRGGEVASRLALETIEALSTDAADDLAGTVRRANEAVFERSVGDRAVAGMGTTLTAVVVRAGEARFAHVGDSRAYLLRAGDLRLVTEDHTLVQQMVRAGEITPAEAEIHPHRSVLTRALGTDPDVDVDELAVPLLEGDRLLLCTDGLTGMLAERQVRAILEAEPDPQRASERLIRAANRAGGVDNVTAVVIDVRGDEEGAAGGAGAGGALAEGRAAGPARRGPDRATLLRAARRAGVAILVAVVALVGFRWYVDRQWYVGEANGHVAIYRGIPAELAGFRLSHVIEEERDLPADRVAEIPFYAGLEDGIAVSSREEAFETVEQMREDLRAAATSQTPTPTPNPSPTP
jgi:protein phosphatase